MWTKRLLIICVIFGGDGSLVSQPPAEPPKPSQKAANASRAARQKFPDFKKEFTPSPDVYPGPLFRLSQDYPMADPSIDDDATLKELLALPYQSRADDQWRRYLDAVRDYCFEGNIEVEWQGQDNAVRKWYHVPWQHWGDKGREGVHGMTREASSVPFQLAPEQTERHDTYAVAIYNAQGGYTIGNVWADPSKPNASKAAFPVGTVVVKILFTTADEAQVPYLKNPLTWLAFARDREDKSERKLQPLQLIQMDIMVREDDAPYGWVFGTYCYNGALGRANRWENLVPVGIQWGNDPGILPKNGNGFAELPVKATVWNDELRETIINPNDVELPPQHLERV